MSGNVIETVMGAVVLVLAAFFLFFAYTTSQVRAVDGYTVTAQFTRVDGIRDGSDVRIAGVKVGSITAENLDPKTYLATLKMSINPEYKLPEDTVAEVISSSLLGDKYRRWSRVARTRTSRRAVRSNTPRLRLASKT